ncbi:hypothetical protein CHGG_06957 [Chaetomium globosum CBS 148.51]|uniref:CCHC-type domain-containing protein n=1 Tax=Chaetomium globosum (strain ATCC 6205 / CBS 148.51 / DSM 1962 / NBRC 6347 / NRRL 1970) TaxID=306901 RepID=Q2GYJ7_CHAGB|nr:uncharacterized protein CHGG_06957 [Chaetomium globosum CBS 148.51]EAQ85704.1 hypothetical protein CHGG_06957 [Chaetomium globosum CBS 148.51]
MVLHSVRAGKITTQPMTPFIPPADKRWVNAFPRAKGRLQYTIKTNTTIASVTNAAHTLTDKRGPSQLRSGNRGWITKAFGQAAEERKRTFTVLAKGILKRDLKGVTEEEFGRSTGLSTVERVRFRIPTREGITRATALISLASQEEAKKACEEGVLWQAQLFDCEPYWGALQATQCYKCWGWGHTQRFCKGKATCPRCAAGVHGGGGRAGEAQCPTLENRIPLRCTACGGRHPAWVRWCPEAVKARGAAREAYFFRPRTFELALQNKQQRQQPLQQMRNITFQGVQDPMEEADDGFQEAGKRKRLRGRPPGFAIAQEGARRDPRQGKLTFAMRVNTALAGQGQEGGMQGAE